VIDAIGEFLGLVGGVFILDLGTIRGIQASPSGLGMAITTVLLSCASDAVGSSPLLFIRRMSPRHILISLVVAILLAVVRLAVWTISFALIASLIERHLVPLPRVMLIVGIGYAPMLLSALVVTPTLGPLIAKLLHAWTLVAIAASIIAAGDLTPQAALSTSVLAWLAILMLSRTSDPLVVRILGGLSRRLLGIDVMQRTREIDLLSQAIGRPIERRGRWPA
jgi:hypothetical protein